MTETRVWRRPDGYRPSPSRFHLAAAASRPAKPVPAAHEWRRSPTPTVMVGSHPTGRAAYRQFRRR